jgi:hypothetical protein
MDALGLMVLQLIKAWTSTLLLAWIKYVKEKENIDSHSLHTRQTLI